MIEKIKKDLSSQKDYHTKSGGFKDGTSEFRDRLKLDDVIEKALGKLDSGTRLYPEVYAHAVSDAILKYLQKLEDQPAHCTLIQFDDLDGVDYFYEDNVLKVSGEKSEATHHARNQGFYSRSSSSEEFSEYLIQFDSDSDADEDEILEFLDKVDVSNCESLLEVLRNTHGIIVDGD